MIDTSGSLPILVVDADDDQRETLCRGLFHLGERCIAARSVEEARALLASRDIGLVLVDVSAPGKLAAAVVRAACDAARPVLAVTGLAPTAEGVALRAAGVPLLRKPFSPDELGRAVHAAMQCNHPHTPTRSRQGE